MSEKPSATSNAKRKSSAKAGAASEAKRVQPRPSGSASANSAVDSAEARSGERVARLRAVIFGVFAVATLSSALSSTATAHFSFWVDKIGGQDFAVSFPIVVAWTLAGIALAATSLLQFRRGAAFRWRRALGLVLPIWITAIFAALLDGTPANLTVLFTATFNYAAPVAIGALAGIISERSGVLNIEIGRAHV